MLLAIILYNGICCRFGRNGAIVDVSRISSGIARLIHWLWHLVIDRRRLQCPKSFVNNNNTSSPNYMHIGSPSPSNASTIAPCDRPTTIATSTPIAHNGSGDGDSSAITRAVRMYESTFSRYLAENGGVPAARNGFTVFGSPSSANNVTRMPLVGSSCYDRDALLGTIDRLRRSGPVTRLPSLPYQRSMTTNIEPTPVRHHSAGPTHCSGIVYSIRNAKPSSTSDRQGLRATVSLPMYPASVDCRHSGTGSDASAACSYGGGVNVESIPHRRPHHPHTTSASIMHYQQQQRSAGSTSSSSSGVSSSEGQLDDPISARFLAAKYTVGTNRMETRSAAACEGVRPVMTGEHWMRFEQIRREYRCQRPVPAKPPRMHHRQQPAATIVDLDR